MLFAVEKGLNIFFVGQTTRELGSRVDPFLLYVEKGFNVIFGIDYSELSFFWQIWVETTFNVRMFTFFSLGRKG